MVAIVFLVIMINISLLSEKITIKRLNDSVARGDQKLDAREGRRS